MTLKSTRGGRGHVAPYETTHVRIPTAIRERVAYISTLYKEAAENETQSEFMISLDKMLEALGQGLQLINSNATQYNNSKLVLSDHEKEEIVSYVQKMTDVYGYCLEMVDSQIQIHGAFRIAIVTAIFMATTDKFDLR